MLSGFSFLNACNHLTLVGNRRCSKQMSNILIVLPLSPGAWNTTMLRTKAGNSTQATDRV